MQSAQAEAVLAGLTSEDEWRKAHLLANPDQFILYYFPHSITRLELFHLRLIETATRENRALILYPAAHGKTTLVSTLLPIWALCKDPNVRVAIIAKNDMEAKSIMRAIQAELISNDALNADFGPFRSESKDSAWSLERLEVAKRTRVHKSATITCFGAGARTAIGYRTDWTICDDVITNENSSTPDQRMKIREWFNLGPETMMEEASGRMTVVGTLFHPEDLYADLVEMRYPDTAEPIYHVQREDAIVDEDKHETLWPARWPWRRLMEQKAKQGTLDFNKRYRNIAVDPSRMVFKEEYIKGGWSQYTRQKHPGCLDKGYKVEEFEPSWRRYAGFDPAVGLSRHAKFCAHCTIAVGSCPEHDKCYWIIDLIREQMTLPQQAELVLDQHERYDLTESFVEANSYQGGLMQVIEEKMEGREGRYRVSPHFTTRTNKPDPELGVQAMSPWFERGEVHIPDHDGYSRRKMGQLVEELVQYPSGRTTDCVMALWFAWRAAQIQAPTYKSFNRLRKKSIAGQLSHRRHVVKNPYFIKEEHGC